MGGLRHGRVPATPRLAGLVAAIAGLVAAAPASALTITPLWDASLTALPDAAIVESAFTAVANDYVASFNTPVDVYINVGWGEVAGSTLPSNAVGASSTNLYGFFNFAQVKALLPLANLPATAPSGVGNYVIASAEAKALGLISPTQTSPDGSIGFAGTTAGYSFAPATLTSKLYDFQSVAAHEIAEVLGRLSGVGTNAWRTPLDLFRFSKPGTLGYSNSSAAYFSTNGGVTNLANFNYSRSGGDRSDWATTSTSLDASDAFIGRGQRKNITAVDLAALDAIGWSGDNLGNSGASPVTTAFHLVAPAGGVPEPSSWALLLAGFGVVGAALRRRTAVAA